MQGDVIVNRIIKDGQLKADEILSNAKNQTDQIFDRAREHIESVKNQSNENLTQQIKLLKERNITLSKIEGNKIVLNKKQEILKNFKLKVLNDLLKLNKKDLLNFLEKLIKKYATNQDVLMFNIDVLDAEDFKKLKIVNDLNLSVDQNKKQEIGLILSNKNCDINLTFMTLIENCFLNFEREVNDILFS